MYKKSTISILYPWKWGPERAATLADVLSAFLVKWPQEFTANDREFLLPGAPTGYTFSADSIGRALKKHLDETVR
jgi:hypothetical protein